MINQRAPHMLGVLGLMGAAALVAADPSRAEAAVTFDYVVSASNVELQPGETGMIDLFIRETVSGDDTSLLVAQNGLSSAHVTVQRTAAGGATQPAGITDFTRNTAGFSGTPFDESDLPGTVDVTQFTSLNASSGPTGASTDGLVLLLNLTVQAGDTPGEVTTFNVFDNPAFDETITFGNTALDSQLGSTSFTVTVSEIPEPAGLGLLGGAIGLTLLRGRRRTTH